MFRGFAASCWQLARREAVLCIAVALAALSAVAVPPSAAYLGYLDWDTLAQLFSLMAVMKGFQQEGLFLWLGSRLLRRCASTRSVALALVALPFFSSMAITNDVSLITFVPFGLTVLRMAGQEHLAVPVAVLQTAAANLGSMLTPMGNPQNLYLYARSGMGFWGLCGLMLPYVAVSGACLAVLVLLHPPIPLAGVAVPARLGSRRALCRHGAGFGLCLLGLFGVVPPPVVAAVVAGVLLAVDRRPLAGVDYPLLGTFAGFFIFIGNLSAVPAFRQLLAAVLEGREALVAVAASQVISNVPAALLLSGFTSRWDALLVGCNLGGLGTLIASMASLISYKLVVQAYPARKGAYLRWFTLCNLGLLGVLGLLAALL